MKSSGWTAGLHVCIRWLFVSRERLEAAENSYARRGNLHGQFTRESTTGTFLTLMKFSREIPIKIPNDSWQTSNVRAILMFHAWMSVKIRIRLSKCALLMHLYRVLKRCSLWFMNLLGLPINFLLLSKFRKNSFEKDFNNHSHQIVI
jgi:hypothetical protein